MGGIRQEEDEITTTPLNDNRRITLRKRTSEEEKERASHYKNIPRLLGGCRDGLGGFDGDLRLGSGNGRHGLFPDLVEKSPVEFKL